MTSTIDASSSVSSMYARTLALVRMAARNVARNPRRTGLSAAAIAFCVAFVWICVALTMGMLDRTVANATEGFTGHVQVHQRDYADDPRLANTIPGSLVAVIEAADLGQPLHVAPRLYGQAYARSGKLGSGAMLLGVEPTRETAASGFADKLESGHAITEASEDEVLLGVGLAERLEVDVGDELELAISTLAEAPVFARFEVAGLVATGIVELDDSAIYMSLARAQALTGLVGRVHEIGIRGADPDQAGELAAKLAPIVRQADPDAIVEPWRVLWPDMALWVDVAAGTFEGFALVIVLVVGTAILLSQSMIVFERRAELGLLRALGLRPRQLLSILVVESSLVAAIGAAIGLVLGGLALLIMTKTGLNLGGGANMEFSGVSISPLVFPTLDLRTPIQAFVSTVLLAALASVSAGLRTALRGPMGVMRDA